MKMAPMKKYVVEITRTYLVTDLIEVNATDDHSAIEMAEEISGDKDYTGKLQLDNVECEVYSDEPIC